MERSIEYLQVKYLSEFECRLQVRFGLLKRISLFQSRSLLAADRLRLLTQAAVPEWKPAC
jgi:hypothetical protein